MSIKHNAELNHAAKKAIAISLINRIHALVEGHGNGERIHWGHVGDLGEVNEQLENIIGFLSDDEQE